MKARWDNDDCCCYQEWTERWLSNLEVPLVVVSHDREFLNRACNKIVHTFQGQATTYLGNYNTFTKLRAFAIDAQKK